MGKHTDQGTSASTAMPAQATLPAADATLAHEKPTHTNAIEKMVADALSDVVKPTPLPIQAPTPTLGTIQPPAEPAASSAPATEAAVAPSGSTPRARLRDLMRLAAMLAVTAALGALAGALGSTMLVHLPSASASDVSATTDEIRAVRAMVGNLDRDLAGLKAGLDAAGKTTNTQLARVGERLDRVERAQSDPAAKLAKISEAVDRLERRGVAVAAAETTGSIGPARPAAAEPNAAPKPAVVEGWILRNVSNGAALVQGRYGVIEIEPGDTVPGLGRVETIKRQDGRWVVVTSRGLIVTR